jgi:hypothetical protein
MKSNRPKHTAGGLRPAASENWPTQLHPVSFEPDQRHVEIAGSPQLIHQAHQFAIRNRLVGAQEDALLLVTRGCAVERARQRRPVDRVVIERTGQVG